MPPRPFPGGKGWGGAGDRFFAPGGRCRYAAGAGGRCLREQRDVGRRGGAGGASEEWGGHTGHAAATELSQGTWGHCSRGAGYPLNPTSPRAGGWVYFILFHFIFILIAHISR